MTAGGGDVFSLPSRLDALVGLRAEVERRARAMQFSDDEVADIVLCVHEAVSNAIVHGNGEVEALPVEVSLERLADGLRVTVRNRGPGFDAAGVMRETAAPAEGPRGRGLRIIERLSDEHSWSDDGRQLTFVRRRRGA